MDEVVGDAAAAQVHTLSKIEEGTEGSLTFLANPKYTSLTYIRLRPQLRNSQWSGFCYRINTIEYNAMVKVERCIYSSFTTLLRVL